MGAGRPRIYGSSLKMISLAIPEDLLDQIDYECKSNNIPRNKYLINSIMSSDVDQVTQLTKTIEDLRKVIAENKASLQDYIKNNEKYLSTIEKLNNKLDDPSQLYSGISYDKKLVAYAKSNKNILKKACEINYTSIKKAVDSIYHKFEVYLYQNHKIRIKQENKIRKQIEMLILGHGYFKV